MKAILFVASTIGLLTAPAVAGTADNPANPAKSEVARKVTPVTVDIPVLPEDPSSPLEPFPELAHRAQAAKPAKARAKAKPNAKAEAKRLDFDYVLGRREASKPSAPDVLHVVPKSLTQAQVATVVQEHMGDLQLCWSAVPKAQRAEACTADLRLSISEAGAVTDIEIVGPVPSRAHTCMAAAISRWTFPAAETRSDVEYAISLRSL